MSTESIKEEVSSKDQEETTKEETTEASTPEETTEEQTTVEPTTKETETEDINISYPVEYSEEELHVTYDDNDIYGTLYMPEDGLSSHKAVILSHGYNCIGADMKDMAKHLAANGIVAYTFDYCGGSARSQSSGESVDMSIKTEQDNLRHVIDMVNGLDGISELYLYGESQGGFVAGLVGAEMPETIDGMFLIYPAFCIVDQWSVKNPDTMKEPFNFMGLKLSKKFYDELPDFDIYEPIKAFDKHVLIYQGDNDYVVDISYAEKIDEAFPDSTLIVVPGAGHGFGGDDRRLVLDGVLEALKKN